MPTPVMFVLLSALVGCVPTMPPAAPEPTFNPETSKAQLRISATEMLVAFKRGDSDAWVGWMPQPLVAEGTKEHAHRMMQELRNDFQRLGVELVSIRLLETSALVPVDSDVYAVQPYEGELTGPKREGQFFGFLICVSTDRGEHWSFLDGYGFNGNRAKLKEMLLKFPDELELPPRKPPQIKRK